MQLSAIRQRGGAEGTIIMHVSASYILTGTRQSVLVHGTAAQAQSTLHMCCVVLLLGTALFAINFPDSCSVSIDYSNFQTQ